MAIQKYGSFDIDAADEALLEASRSGNGDRLKLKQGQNILRFLPPPVGRRQPFAIIYQHWVTTAESKRVPMNCARMMAKQRCAACEKMDDLLRSNNSADKAAAEDWKAKRSVAVNVIDREDEDRGVQLLNFGDMILKQLIAIRKDARAGGDFTDAEDGFDIIIERTGEKKSTKYAVRGARNTTPLHEDPSVAAGWIDNQVDVDRLKLVPSYDDQLEMLGGEAPRQTRDLGRVNAAGQRRPEVLEAPPAAAGRRRSVADDTDVPF